MAAADFIGSPCLSVLVVGCGGEAGTLVLRALAGAGLRPIGVERRSERDGWLLDADTTTLLGESFATSQDNNCLLNFHGSMSTY